MKRIPAGYTGEDDNMRAACRPDVKKKINIDV